ncbi:YwiC-like family protein [Actinoplanes sichuanensis]|uniref:YwiC-like family protein n=1 Tax=Actinoplanes sichuanensis TaxID=512349 RepID=A0ABW4A5R8_9ACTN|nr:YwiC-like family protein [Actinoplanes sichuanensis]BEL03076.1 YwiC-like family protein [Actinoplanes sichuanensis]
MTTATRTRRRQYVPPQHGAWAMLLLPYLAGLLIHGFAWPAVPLLGAWIAGYLLSYYVLQAIKTRRLSRFRPQITLYAPVTAALALPVVLARPALWWFAPAYAALLAVNAWFAWRRRERALVNDLASVVQSCLMVPVVAVVAGATPHWPPFAVVLLYFTGTVLFVKTMIRERGSVPYRRASIGYHLAALAAATVIGTFAGLVFAGLLGRAWLLPGRPLTPKQVGFVEIGASVLVLAAAALAG